MKLVTIPPPQPRRNPVQTGHAEPFAPPGAWKLHTNKLGDSICLYTVLRHRPDLLHQWPFGSHFEGLLEGATFTPSGVTWVAPERFMSSLPDGHVIDRLAMTYEVDPIKLKDPLWTRPPVGNYVALCPHATVEAREWHTAHWSALVQALEQRHIPYRFLYGRPQFGRDGTTPPLSFPEFVNQLTRAKAVITVDSGQAHLADAFGVPVVGLYGPIRSRHWGAYHQRHLAIDGEDKWRTRATKRVIDRITVQDVLIKLNHALSA